MSHIAEDDTGELAYDEGAHVSQLNRFFQIVALSLKGWKLKMVMWIAIRLSGNKLETISSKIIKQVLCPLFFWWQALYFPTHAGNHVTADPKSSL